MGLGFVVVVLASGMNWGGDCGSEIFGKGILGDKGESTLTRSSLYTMNRSSRGSRVKGNC